METCSSFGVSMLKSFSEHHGHFRQLTVGSAPVVIATSEAVVSGELERDILMNMDRKLDDLLRQGQENSTTLEFHETHFEKIDKRLDEIVSVEIADIRNNMVRKADCDDRHGVPSTGAGVKRKERRLTIIGWFVAAGLALVTGYLLLRVSNQDIHEQVAQQLEVQLGSHDETRTRYKPTSPAYGPTLSAAQSAWNNSGTASASTISASAVIVDVLNPQSVDASDNP